MKIALYGKKVDSTHASEIQVLFDLLLEHKIPYVVHNFLQESIVENKFTEAEQVRYF